MFHANVLPLSHLLAIIDGKTVGPRGFSRPIGKLLAFCEKLPTMKLEPIDIFRGIEPSDLGTDRIMY